MAPSPSRAPAAAAALAVAAALLLALHCASTPAAAAVARVVPIGLHFDVEPQALQNWNSVNASQDDIISGLVDLLGKLNTRWTANGRPGKLVWDMPNWYDGYSLTKDGVTKTYAQWVMDSGIDRINIMNFVDSEPLLIARMQTELDYAKQKNLEISAAVETQNLSLSSISFFEEGKEYMQNTLVAADKALRQLAPSVWQEFTIHDYHAMLEMPSSNGTQYVSDRINVCMYVWQWWLAFNNGTADRQAMWTFLAAQPYTITRILFESEALLREDQQTLQAFIDEAASKGYQVEMAVGFSRWVLPQYHNWVEEIMQLAANFIRYGPVSDPLNNPPTGAPPFPTASPAPTVVKTDIPWPTDGGFPTNMPTAAPTGTSGGGGGGDGTAAPTSAPTGTSGGGGRVPIFQSEAAVLPARAGVAAGLALALGVLLAALA